MPVNKPSDVFLYIDMSGGPDSCWQWNGPVGGRQGEQRPYFQAGGKRKLAYRLVWELVNGRELTVEEKLLHSCDNGAMPIGCCNYHHVRIGTVKENSEDMMERERHGLPKHVANTIRKLYAQGRKQQDIADLYGISQENVSAIVRRITHKMEEGSRNNASEPYTTKPETSASSEDTPSDSDND